MLYRFCTCSLALTLLALTSCGESGNALADTAAALEGVYEIDDFTRNKESCDSDGDSALDELSQTHFFIKTSIFPPPINYTFIQALGCDDPASCRADAADTGKWSPSFSYGFDSSSGEGQLSGIERSSGFGPTDGICKTPHVGYVELTTVSPGTIKIVQEDHTGDDYPADEKGWCNTTLGYEASVGKPCSEREVLTAHRVGGL